MCHLCRIRGVRPTRTSKQLFTGNAMPLDKEMQTLASWKKNLAGVYMELFGQPGANLYIFDMMLLGSMKRSISLSAGLHALVEAKNMVCARAIVRMQIDTLTRLSGYLYVNNPDEVAKEVIGGKKLSSFKSADGEKLQDKYLVDRMAEQHPWVRKVYDTTSGYIHFSEKQLFDSVLHMDEDKRTITFAISDEDEKFPEASWTEVVACFNHLIELHIELAKLFRSARTSPNIAGT